MQAIAANILPPLSTQNKRSKKSDLSPEQEEMNAKCMEIWNILRHSEEEGSKRIRSEIFLIKPSRRQYPDYYEIIKNPIDMKTIKKSIETGKYTDKEEVRAIFIYDLPLCNLHVL